MCAMTPQGGRLQLEEYPVKKTIFLVANGDLRLSANQKCWPVQVEVEEAVFRAVQARGHEVRRGHDYDPDKRHGFIDSQKRGIEAFRNIPLDAPLLVVEAVWQYSQHLLPGLLAHRGPILTVANWSGQWPGLVGLLNLNASLRKAGKQFDTLWSVDFKDSFFLDGLTKWLGGRRIRHDRSHIRAAAKIKLPKRMQQLGQKLAGELRRDKALLGVFDEGCMGMYNAIIPDELLQPMGVFKERLSQSALYAEMLNTPEAEARAIYQWLLDKGMRFEFGPVTETDLTEAQVLEQCKMYIATLRIADEFGCAAVGIQYQQGLKDLTPASDLAEGLLNNVDRPPVKDRSGKLLYPGQPLPHFNEVDEGVALDALVTNRVWTALGLAPETTLHDVRYGETYGHGKEQRFVWTLEISGSVPPAHFARGYAEAVSERQPPIYFRLGGGTIKGISKPGHVVWSRIYVEPSGLKADAGLAHSVELPQAETERRWQITTPQWPMMHTVFPGISRDQFMARHCSNHIQVAYAPDAANARKALAAKVAMFRAMGIDVYFCGDVVFH
jgi:L-fucose isomerase-like protein